MEVRQFEASLNRRDGFAEVLLRSLFDHYGIHEDAIQSHIKNMDGSEDVIKEETAPAMKEMVEIWNKVLPQ